MAYIVSARKYRPRTFDEVVGQKAVTHILKKAIEQKRLPQALLFTGPRGVGKTSCARIMAREVNKAYLDDPDQDLSFNIFELDAASNNSVDDIRELINQVNIPPQIGKYKVYIIDEVHMLSNQAFNAFLKTLEEPPEHAIFILATTEKHKILPTILSRCQVFDFRRISVKEIQQHLRKIADAEGVDIEDEALYLIAKKADGALRDALSAFDKIVNIGEGRITRQMVSEYLGILDRDVYARMAGLLLAGDRTGLLKAFNELVDKGVDIYHFVGGLASFLRDVMLATDPEALNILDYPAETKEQLAQLARRADYGHLLQAVDWLTQTDLNYKTSQHPLLLTELTLLRIAELMGGPKKKTAVSLDSSPSQTQPPGDSRPFSGPAGASGRSAGSASAAAASLSPSAADIPPAEPAANVSATSSDTEIQTGGKSPAASSSQTPPASAQTATEPISGGQLLGLGALKKLKNKPSDEPRREAFTQADLDRLKDEFLEFLANRKRKSEYVILKSIEMQAQGEIIEMKMDSKLTMKGFAAFSDEFLHFLKNHLRNDFIIFRPVVIEKPKEKKVRYYTDAEKISRLTELNPHIQRLITVFKLRHG